MAVRVELSNGNEHHYNNGTKWFIDDERQLHVIDATGTHIAAVGTNAWAAVGVCEAAAEEA